LKTEKCSKKTATPQWTEATFTFDIDDPTKDIIEIGMFYSVSKRYDV
jgi:hypothetical protein